MEQTERAKVLIVNDQPDVLLAMQAVLADMNLHLVAAQSGMEALKHLLNEDFAVILMDVKMPVMDGFETAAIIRRRPRSESTPIIFITAHSFDHRDLATGYGLGAVDYLFAPVVPEILRAKVAAFADLFLKTEQLKRQSQELLLLNEAMQTHNSQISRLNREIESFSYSVSHDLRAPLRSIAGFSQMLSDDYADQLDAEGQNYLQRIRVAAKHMADLIDDLLNLSRITRTEIHCETVNMSELAQTIASELYRTQPERQVDFVIADGLVADGDARLLRIALENLLGNAWKFTAKHPQARIEVGAMEDPENGLVFFVRDDGDGFDMAYADKLFGAFQRLHAMTEFEGTGIGLATVQRIIHRHGGKIWAEGEVGKGATFYFVL